MTGVVFTVQALDTDATLSTVTTFTYSIVLGNDQINGGDSFSVDSTGKDFGLPSLMGCE